MKYPVYTPPCILPICMALASLNASPAQAACVPTGTPQDDTIVCTGDGTTAVNADGGDDYVRVETGSSLLIEPGDGPAAIAIDLGNGNSTVEIDGFVQNMTSQLEHQTSSGGLVHLEASLDPSSVGLYIGFGEHAAATIGAAGRVSAEAWSRAEVDAAAFSPIPFWTCEADAWAASWNSAHAINATVKDLDLTNAGSIFARTGPEIDTQSPGPAAAEADAPSFGVEVGNGDSLAHADSRAISTGVTVQAAPGQGLTHAEITNEETGRISATASAWAEADGPASSESLLNPVPDPATSRSKVHATATADATAIELDVRESRVVNNGVIDVSAHAVAESDAVADSTSWGTLVPFPPWYCPLCPGLVEAYATSTADSTATAYGIQTYGGDDGVLNDTTGTIDVRATAEAYSDSIAIWVGVPFGWDVSAEANATALATGIDGGDGNNDITNRGTISVHANASGVSSATVDGIADAAETNLSATAVGIQTGQGNDVIRNYGKLSTSVNVLEGERFAVRSEGGDDAVMLLDGSTTSGRIELGTGDDTLLIEAGAVVDGISFGGPGFDTFVLGGDTSGALDLARIGADADFRDFDAFRKGGPSTWTLTGDKTIDWTVDAGTLAIAGQLTGTVQTEAASSGAVIDVLATGRIRSEVFSPVVLDGTGTFINRGVIDYQPMIDGMVVTHGTVVNRSSTSVLVLGNGNRIINSGQISVRGPDTNESVGILLSGSDAQVVNAGVIRSEGVTGSGVVLAGNGGVVFNYGVLAAAGPAVSFESAAGTYNTLINRVGGSVESTGTLAVAGGAGNDALANDSDIQGAVDLGDGNNDLTNRGSMFASVTTGAGIDALVNDGDIQGAVHLGDGNNDLTNRGSILGVVTSGTGDDVLINDGDLHDAVDLGDGNNDLVNHGSILSGVTTGTGDDAIANDGEIQGAVDLGDGNNHVANHGSMLNVVTTGAGDDALANFGEIRGMAGIALGLGAGADRLMIAASSLIDGTADGGADTDTFVLGGGVDGSFDLDEIDSAYIGFEQFGKEDTSRWVLVGSANGPWTLADGALIVNGTLLGDMLVESPGRLGGIGAVGTLVNHGTVAPGNSIGVLGVARDYVHGPDAVLEVEVDGAGRGDRVNVGGTATLQGGTLQVVAQGPFGIATEYSILEAAVGIDGGFASLHSTLDFLDPELDYEPNRIMLTVIRNDFSFASFGETFNQLAVGTALDANKKAAARGDFKPAMDEFLSLAADEIPAALDAVDGELHATAQTSLLRAADAFLTTAVDRQLSASRKEDGNRVVWADGFGAYGSPDADGNASGADYRTTGIATGIDVTTGANARLGLAFGFSNSSTDLDRPGAVTADANSLHFAVYGAYEEGPWSLRSALAYSRQDVDAERAIRYGTTDRVAKSSYDADQYSAYVRGSGGIGMTTDASLQPFVTLAWSQLDRGHFSESGADSLNLTVKAGQTHSLLSVLGLRAVWDRPWQRGHVRPELSVGWVHQYLDDHGVVTASLEGAAPSDGYQSFTIRGVTTPRDGLLAGAGLVVDLGQNSRVFLSYDLAHDTDGTDQAVVAGVRVAW